ncbi:hypothetical protein QJQ45_030498 [Haematococcus lacustris]|nr:hypothetical protein QJQ45_030498 [Haematococcus lacustris]
MLVPDIDSEQASSDMHKCFNDSYQQGQTAEGGAACGTEKVLNLPPSAQQLAPLALDLVWGMEGMLQMMKQHWHMFWSVACVKKSSTMSSLFRSSSTSIFLFGHVIRVLADPAAVGPAGLAAQPASWLPSGNSLVEGWCSQLLDRVCQLLYVNSPGLEGPMDNPIIKECQELACSHTFVFQVQEQGPPSMTPEAERLLSCLTLVLTVALPLDTWLAAAPSLPATGAEITEQAIHDVLTRVEPEQVWSWQALAAGTPAEASLASVLQGAANKLQLPHLVAPAPQGWQPGRLTLNTGRAPPELLILLFKQAVQAEQGTNPDSSNRIVHDIISRAAGSAGMLKPIPIKPITHNDLIMGLEFAARVLSRSMYVGVSGSGQQEVVGERRQVIKAAIRGLVEAALPDLSPAQIDAVEAEVNKRMTNAAPGPPPPPDPACPPYPHPRLATRSSPGSAAAPAQLPPPVQLNILDPKLLEQIKDAMELLTTARVLEHLMRGPHHSGIKLLPAEVAVFEQPSSAWPVAMLKQLDEVHLTGDGNSLNANATTISTSINELYRHPGRFIKWWGKAIGAVEGGFSRAAQKHCPQLVPPCPHPGPQGHL